MDNLTDLLTDTPLPDVHAKPRESPLALTRFQAARHHSTVRMSSAELQRMMGLRLEEVEMFDGPPAVPQELKTRFLRGCEEYGLDKRMEVEEHGGEMGAREGKPARRQNIGDMVIASIMEGMERSTIGGGNEGRESLPYDLFSTLCSATPLAQNEPWIQNNPSNISQAYGDQHMHDASYVYPQRLAELRHTNQRRPTGEMFDNTSCYHGAHEEKENRDNTQQPAATTTTLFPSPTVGQTQCWPSLQPQTTSVAPQTLPLGGHRRMISNKPTTQLPKPIPLENRLRYKPPKINIQPASPKRTKKRPASPCHDSEQPTIRNGRSDTGLPLLPANAPPISGNHPGLMNTLLTWSITLSRLQQHMPDPYLISINPAFPPTFLPPIHQDLIAVGFYDTSFTPAREVRFIGPGDVERGSWNKVHIFTYADGDAGGGSLKMSGFKLALGLPSPPPSSLPVPTYQHRRHGEALGEGTWAYILLKGHATMPMGPISKLQAKPPPHIIVGMPNDAITEEKSCAWTVYPDDEEKIVPMGPPLAPGPRTRSKGLAPVHVLSRLDPVFYKKGIRAASTASPASSSNSVVDGVVGADEPNVKKSGLLLTREVLKMEKAGKVPLFEGYRVNVGAWKEWIDAVGKGCGQIVLWKQSS